MTKGNDMSMDEVAEIICAISIMARRIGHEFKVDETKLEAMGYSSGDIDDIFIRCEMKVRALTTSE